MFYRSILVVSCCCNFYSSAIVNQFPCVTHFIRHSKRVLLSKKTLPVQASNLGQCILHCSNQRFCKSVNFAIHNTNSNTGLHLCELLEQDRYSDSGNFVESSVFDHHGPKSPCESFPCLNGGSCITDYVNYTFSCVCKDGFFGKYCEATVAAECTNYTSLSGADRLTSIGDIKHLCDSKLSKGWYRFTGPTGVKIPETLSPVDRCNTDATGWLNGTHPSISEGLVTREVCFNWSGNPCRWTKNIRVLNCGSFYMYELVPTGACSLRYCTEQ